ncbi:MAG: hypothetical protein MUF35_09675 [Candidatus Nanopelagicales bacterium]|nr:hypothetical protein [Candidatus Nanopelagicales bacterium]
MVEEPLSEVELVLGELALVVAADVAGADVLQAVEGGLAQAELDDVGGPVDVHAAGDRLGHGQVVDRREVPHLGDLAQAGAVDHVDAQALLGDVADDQVDAVGELGAVLDEGGDALLGQLQPALLHQQVGVRVRAPVEDAGEHGGAQEAGEAGHQHVGHGDLLSWRRPPGRSLRSGRSGPSARARSDTPSAVLDQPTGE